MAYPCSRATQGMAQATPKGQINVVSTSILDCTTQNPFAVATPSRAKPGIMCGSIAEEDWLWGVRATEYLGYAVAQVWHNLGTQVFKPDSMVRHSFVTVLGQKLCHFEGLL